MCRKGKVLTQKEIAKIGVTPIRGGPIPRYILFAPNHTQKHQVTEAVVSIMTAEIMYESCVERRTYPLTPSLAKVFFTTSIAPV